MRSSQDVEKHTKGPHDKRRSRSKRRDKRKEQEEGVLLDEG
jgi:hypothetical protein